MKEYLVCEVADHYGVSLSHARRLTEEEKGKYSEWYREQAFISIKNTHIDLDALCWYDIAEFFGKNRKADGSFLGCSNLAYIISAEEQKKLIELNNQKKSEKQQKEIQEKINFYETAVQNCEKQKKLYTEEEAKAKRKAYNNLHNEGGEGYIPHFYTIDEYERFKSQLKDLKEKQKELPTI